jgi:hypothetical protein
MITECPDCRAHVDAVEVGAFDYPASDVCDPGRYMLLKCNRCSRPILINQEREINASDDDGWTEPTVIYPQSDLRVNPKAPPDIQRALQEGIVCYNAHAFTAAAIMCRKTLEGVCMAHGIAEKSLDRSLKKMAESDLIDKRLFDWSDQLRIVGNEAAHGVGTMSSSQDARDALDFTIGIVDYLFSYRDQFKRFRERQRIRNEARDL